MMKPTQELHEMGQSLWLDNITRTMLDDGTEQGYIDELDVTGQTSNPTIFDKAISSGDAYDEQITELREKGLDGEELFFELALADVTRAAKMFKGIYEETDRMDGWVSLEVSPKLAYDTQATIRQAAELHGRAEENNFIKIPGTPEGLPAIEESIASGINVNVTLLFSLQRYEEIHWAYIRGLERRVEQGEPIDDIHSVASFFVSRVDTAVDKLLPDGSPLRGKAAVANAKMAYQRYLEIVDDPRWRALESHGATRQRPLWASTGTKNPEYSDVLYVESLIGPETVNTMPDQTVEAFQDHGKVERTVDRDLDGARDVLRQLKDAGIDLDDVTHKLEVEGVKSFSDSFDSLIETISGRLSGVGERGAA